MRPGAPKAAGAVISARPTCRSCSTTGRPPTRSTASPQSVGPRPHAGRLVGRLGGRAGGGLRRRSTRLRHRRLAAHAGALHRRHARSSRRSASCPARPRLPATPLPRDDDLAVVGPMARTRTISRSRSTSSPDRTSCHGVGYQLALRPPRHGAARLRVLLIDTHPLCRPPGPDADCARRLADRLAAEAPPSAQQSAAARSRRGGAHVHAAPGDDLRPRRPRSTRIARTRAMGPSDNRSLAASSPVPSAGIATG